MNKKTIEHIQIEDNHIFCLNIETGNLPLNKAEEYCKKFKDGFKEKIEELGITDYKIIVHAQRNQKHFVEKIG